MFEVATLVGAGGGFLAKCYMNAVRKQPLTRAPWEHAALMVAGGYFGYYTREYEIGAIARLERKEKALAEHNAAFKEKLAASSQ